MIETTNFQRERGAVLVDPRAVVEIGQPKPGAVVPTTQFAAGSVVYASEMAAFEKARSAQYLQSEEWLAFAAENGSEMDAKEEAALMLRRDNAVADAVAAGIRLLTIADEKALQSPPKKRVRRMTKSH